MERGGDADCLWKYGDERESRRIARKIVQAREENGPLETTAQLAAVLKAAGGKVREPKELMRRQSRVFQALRIEVNQEIAELENVLHAAAELIKPGGRLAIMSYHSLEDRRAKRLLRSGTFFDAAAQGCLRQRARPVEAADPAGGGGERGGGRRNTRARSARLRIGERLEHPAVPPSEESGPHGVRGGNHRALSMHQTVRDAPPAEHGRCGARRAAGRRRELYGVWAV